jgi:hypothetical protein
VGFSEWLHIDFKVIQSETNRAFKVIAEDNKIYWIPKSQVANRKDYKAGDRNGTISVTEWYAVKEGWCEAEA